MKCLYAGNYTSAQVIALIPEFQRFIKFGDYVPEEDGDAATESRDK